MYIHSYIICIYTKFTHSVSCLLLVPLVIGHAWPILDNGAPQISIDWGVDLGFHRRVGRNSCEKLNVLLTV